MLNSTISRRILRTKRTSKCGTGAPEQAGAPVPSQVAEAHSR